jgi:hypothetical protein
MKIIGRKTIKTDKTSAPMVKAAKAKTKAVPSHEEIAVRAYELYLDRGDAPGSEETDWLKAEAELSAR